MSAVFRFVVCFIACQPLLSGVMGEGGLVVEALPYLVPNVDAGGFELLGRCRCRLMDRSGGEGVVERDGEGFRIGGVEFLLLVLAEAALELGVAEVWVKRGVPGRVPRVGLEKGALAGVHELEIIQQALHDQLGPGAVKHAFPRDRALAVRDAPEVLLQLLDAGKTVGPAKRLFVGEPGIILAQLDLVGALHLFSGVPCVARW